MLRRNKLPTEIPTRIPYKRRRFSSDEATRAQERRWKSPSIETADFAEPFDAFRRTVNTALQEFKEQDGGIEKSGAATGATFRECLHHERRGTAKREQVLGSFRQG